MQYAVPLYQRPYVWREDKHWQPLWEDVQTVVRQLLDGAEAGDGVMPIDETPPHFLGAVVLDQKRTRAGSIEQRHIIDGQQRLTTLQLLISAASKVAANRGLDRSARLLEALTRNNPDLMASDTDEFKVWPTNIDRNAFGLAMRAPDDGSKTQDDPFNLVQEAHAFFYRAIDEWVDDQLEVTASAEDRFHALVETLRDLVQIVVIDLEESDNAQVIFETLNARGTPLLAIDLVKNLVFYRAQSAGEDVEALYKNYWRPLEHAYWREEVVQGRLTRARAEIFLMHWLTMKRLDEINAHHLYDSFRGLLESDDTRGSGPLLAEFAADAKLFQSFDTQPPGSPLHEFFTHLRALDTATVIPVILFLFKQESLSAERRLLALAALESWLVRRMICGFTTRAYNRHVVDLLQAMGEAPQEADNRLIAALRESTADASLWPSDEQVQQALVSLPFYRRLAQPRQRLVLAAVENAMRSEKSEEVAVPANLTIEHILPQSWKQHWPVDPPGDLAAELEREKHIHLLGNLTLATGKLNPDMSNGPWHTKREALNEHSVLLLNRRLVDFYPERWDEQSISARSLELAEYIKRIWPGPAADWSVTAMPQAFAQSQLVPNDIQETASPEDLIARYAPNSSQVLLDRFLDELSYWPEVKVWPGGSSEERWRPIYFSRAGSPVGAFCQLLVGTARLRFRLQPDDAPFSQFAEARAARGPYLLQVRLIDEQAFGEAVRLARLAFEFSIPTN